MDDADPLNPLRVFHELSPRLPDGCILTADSGSATNWWARHLKLRKGMKAALSGTLATMCPAAPYAYSTRPYGLSSWPPNGSAGAGGDRASSSWPNGYAGRGRWPPTFRRAYRCWPGGCAARPVAAGLPGLPPWPRA